MLNRIGQWSPKQTSWLEEIINMNQLFLSVYWHPRIRGRVRQTHREKLSEAEFGQAHVRHIDAEA